MNKRCFYSILAEISGVLTTRGNSYVLKEDNIRTQSEDGHLGPRDRHLGHILSSQASKGRNPVTFTLQLSTLQNCKEHLLLFTPPRLRNCVTAALAILQIRKLQPGRKEQSWTQQRSVHLFSLSPMSFSSHLTACCLWCLLFRESFLRKCFHSSDVSREVGLLRLPSYSKPPGPPPQKGHLCTSEFLLHWTPSEEYLSFSGPNSWGGRGVFLRPVSPIFRGGQCGMTNAFLMTEICI